MLPMHLERLISVSVPAVHPEGWAVVGAGRADFATDDYVGQLWRIPIDGGEPRRITRGFRDSQPKFSPDGSLIGFLRAFPGRPAQLAVIPAHGGEPVFCTDQPNGVLDFAFTEDSRRLVFSAEVPNLPQPVTNSAARPPHRITGLQFRMDGRGWTVDRSRQLFVVPVPDPWGEPAPGPAATAPGTRQLTFGEYDHGALTIHRGAVVVATARHPDREADLRVDLYRIDLDNAAATPLTGPTISGMLYSFTDPTSSGGQLYARGIELGTSGRDFVVNSGVYLIRAGQEPRRLTDAETIDIAAIAPVTHGGGVLAVVEERGSGIACHISAGGTMTRLHTPPRASVRAIAAAGGAAGTPAEPPVPIVASIALPDSPGEVAILGTKARVVTDFAASLNDWAPALEPIEMVAHSSDGTEVHGWVVPPPGPGPHPTILLLHGGPFVCAGPAFFDEAQVYARAGYAVVMCNPRGSSSYGRAFGQAVIGALGDCDVTDVLAFLDHALAALPELDPTRIGVMGGSYGGYLTALITAEVDRFAAAIVERGYLDPEAYVGAGDIGWYFPAGYEAAAGQNRSPMAVVGQVETPTLVIHAEDDLRCPLSSAARYYTELRLRGVPSEFLVFPGGNHNLSRSGSPAHRRQRFEAILEWWSRYLPVSTPVAGGRRRPPSPAAAGTTLSPEV